MVSAIDSSERKTGAILLKAGAHHLWPSSLCPSPNISHKVKTNSHKVKQLVMISRLLSTLKQKDQSRTNARRVTKISFSLACGQKAEKAENVEKGEETVYGPFTTTI
jgi:hypothetical protein